MARRPRSSTIWNRATGSKFDRVTTKVSFQLILFADFYSAVRSADVKRVSASDLICCCCGFCCCWLYAGRTYRCFTDDKNEAGLRLAWKIPVKISFTLASLNSTRRRQCLSLEMCRVRMAIPLKTPRCFRIHVDEIHGNKRSKPYWGIELWPIVLLYVAYWKERHVSVHRLLINVTLDL